MYGGQLYAHTASRRQRREASASHQNDQASGAATDRPIRNRVRQMDVCMRPVWRGGGCYDARMTRTVGRQDRTELILDPAEALRRGRVLDAMLAGLLPPRPRGVTRATHQAMNQADDARQLEVARRLNGPR